MCSAPRRIWANQCKRRAFLEIDPVAYGTQTRRAKQLAQLRASRPTRVVKRKWETRAAGQGVQGVGRDCGCDWDRSAALLAPHGHGLLLLLTCVSDADQLTGPLDADSMANCCHGRATCAAPPVRLGSCQLSGSWVCPGAHAAPLAQVGKTMRVTGKRAAGHGPWEMSMSGTLDSIALLRHINPSSSLP